METRTLKNPRCKFRGREELSHVIRNMEYDDAMAAVSSAINAQVFTIADNGNYSGEAVEAAEKLLAAWFRVQRPEWAEG